MCSGTGGAVSRNRAVVQAGRAPVIQGVPQLMLTGWLSRTHAGGWSVGTAWFPRRGLFKLRRAAGAFWLTLGGFARPEIPLAVFGDGVLIDRPEPAAA